MQPKPQCGLSEPVLAATLELWSQAGRAQWIRLDGGSMLPLMRDGDHIRVNPGCTDVRPGDVCVFRQRNRLVAHRVLRVIHASGEQTVLTKGDGVPWCDPPVPVAALVGRVLALRRGERIVSLDTSVARVGGWCIARLSLLWLMWRRRVCPAAWEASRGACGPLQTMLRRSGAVCSSAGLRVVHAILWRS